MTTETADAGTIPESQATQAAATDAATTGTDTPAQGEANANPEGTDAGAKDDGKAGDAAPVYEFKVPEGMELDAGDVDAFKALATEAKLKPEIAQKVLDLQIAREQARAEAFAKQVADWGDQVKADKEIGGAKLAENLAHAKAAIDKFGGPEFKSLLDSTGMGNHPEVVRFVVQVGKAISQDSVVRGSPGEGNAKDAASALYGSTSS